MAFSQEVVNADFPQRSSRRVLEDCERRDDHPYFLPWERSGQMVRCGSLCETRRPWYHMRWV